MKIIFCIPILLFPIFLFSQNIKLDSLKQVNTIKGIELKSDLSQKNYKQEQKQIGFLKFGNKGLVDSNDNKFIISKEATPGYRSVYELKTIPAEKLDQIVFEFEKRDK